MADGGKGPLVRARERLGRLVKRGQASDEAAPTPRPMAGGSGGAAVPESGAEPAANGAEQATPRVPRGAVRAGSARGSAGGGAVGAAGETGATAESNAPAAHAEAAVPTAEAAVPAVPAVSGAAGNAGAGNEQSAELGEQLSAVADLLERQLDVRRALADSGSRDRSRVQLVDRLFGGQLSNASLDVLRELVSERWPTSLALVSAIDKRASTAQLSASGDDLDDVEDELFRFSRTVERESKLSLALSDPGLPPERKDALLGRLLEGKAHPTTVTLVRRVVHHPRGRSIPRALEDLARMAADLRQRSIAEVTVASTLDADQTERLRQAVSAAFDREVELQIFVDPMLLGGVVVRVGDEVVDGSILRRLADARRQLVR